MLQSHAREQPIAGYFPIPCEVHNFRFFVPTGELRQTEVHASWQGSCVRGDLFFEAPDCLPGTGATYDAGALPVDGDTDIRLPFDLD